jgi:hypothetical protein
MKQHIGTVGGKINVVSVEFTRPANQTPYAAYDVVSNSESSTVLMEFANFVRQPGGTGYIVGARLSTDLKSITPRFRVHLFNGLGMAMSVDNLAWKEHYTASSLRIGYFDLGAMTTGFDTNNSTMSRVIDFTLRIPFKAANSTRSIYAVLETLDVFTPASGQKFTLTLCGDLD